MWVAVSVRACVCVRARAVEQEQIQKRTFTNWVNAQLAKVSARSTCCCRVCGQTTSPLTKVHILDALELHCEK